MMQRSAERLFLIATLWYGVLVAHAALVPSLQLRGGGAVASLPARIQYALAEAQKDDVWNEGRLVENAGTARDLREKRAQKLVATAVGGAKPNPILLESDEEVIDFEEPELQDHDYEYDLIVIGGGSGGLACSKEAADLGAKVAVCDFVSPTPMGTTWGLGGTCVNVGCIPKKLMHRAAVLHEAIEDAQSYGWEVGEEVKHDWKKMVNGVQDHIASLNFGYRSELRSKNVTYFNALATFVDEHTVECTDSDGKKTRHTAASFVIAVGGRPKYPDLPGDKECCITSDDLFSLSSAPGKTLVVGASYVALECAGFLSGLGYDATVMMRSIPLRGFDMECSEKVCEYMEKHGTAFKRKQIPTRFEKHGKKVKVWYKNASGTGSEASEEYDTVVLAIGRYALSEQLGLDKVRVEVNSNTLKIVGKSTGVGGHEQSSAEHIFALGDVLQGRPELTPVAIQAGVLLARRLFGGGKDQMDYNMVPTTVFTPLEYGCVGLSEEEAESKYGKEGLEVYHAQYTPLEWSPPSMEFPPRPTRDAVRCFCKVICERGGEDENGQEEDDDGRSGRIIGMHIVGDNAGEIIQGFALGVKMGARKKDLDALVGVHPTGAEAFTTMAVTKRSGLTLQDKGC